MTLARKQLVNPDHTLYYHCTVRCVRRAFLCGRDRSSGKNFEHRKVSLEKRLKILSEIFAIDLVAYAIMSNHYHVVIRLDPDRQLAWSDERVINRWRRLFKRASKYPDPATLALWRMRLADLSWYMRSINEPLARLANREDRCKGRFWEGRFRSQALLDDQALLKCMAYVDLNPIRAGIAATPESSAHTSIKARIDGRKAHLASFNSLPCRLTDYLELVDWTGRVLRGDKRGTIGDTLPPILSRLSKDADSWRTEMQHYGNWYYLVAGQLDSLTQLAETLGRQWFKGKGIVSNTFA